MKSLNHELHSAVNIARHISARIHEGSWPPGFRLPTVRALAAELGVNPNTVSAAYKQLRNAGVIATDGRRGSFVPHRQENAVETVIAHGLRDLASGHVDARLLPQMPADILADYRLSSAAGSDGQHPPFRRFVQQWLRRQAGVSAEAVFFSSSLDIMERALSQRCIPGDRVVLENPCWPPLLALLAHLRLEAVPADVDEEGAAVPSPVRLQGAAAVVLTARAHSPTGIGYSRERWQAWQRALAGQPALLIVDDHWAALSRQPFHGMDGFGNEWLYSTSTSKFLGTDARIAIAAGNGPTLQAMQRRFALGPRWMSPLLQHIVWRLWRELEDGGLARMAASYQNRRDLLIGCLNSHGIDVPGAAGEGQHIWLPVGNEAHTLQFLAARGWAVQSGAALNLSRQSAVRITIGALDEADCAVLAQDIAASRNTGARTVY